MKVGLLDVGGGLRDAFGAGVFDFLLDNNIDIPSIVGISAGSANAVNYMSKQRGRSLKFYTDYDLRKKSMSISNYLKTGEYLNLDYLYEEISAENGENPFDYDTFKKSKTKLLVVATKAKDGKPKVFTNKDIHKDDYEVLSASSCLPIMCKPRVIDGEEYFDGSISAPIPIELLRKEKVDKIIIILTRPIDFRKDDSKRKKLYKRLEKDYKEFTKVLYNRSKLYNDALEEILSKRDDNILILAPSSTKGLKTLTKDKEKLKKLYEEGYKKAEKIINFIK